VATVEGGAVYTAASAEGTVAGVATLSATDKNTVTWVAVTNATGYKVYRTTAGTTPNTTGLIATITSGSTVTVDDTGLVAGAAAPSGGTSGQIVAGSGTLVIGSPVSTLLPYQAIAGTGAITACAGHVIRVTATGTVTLPAATTLGQNCLIVSTTAAVISVDPASAADAITLDQSAALAGGNKATSDGTIRAQLFCHNPVANSWTCNTVMGVWSDGGA
jgi:hypothetical protein